MLRRFAQLARERGFALVLIREPVSHPEYFLWRAEFDVVIDEIAAEYDLPVVDPWPALDAERQSFVFGDAVHPTERGHEIIAQQLLPVVRDALPQR